MTLQFSRPGQTRADETTSLAFDANADAPPEAKSLAFDPNADAPPEAKSLAFDPGARRWPSPTR